MLEVFTRLIGFTILNITGIYIVRTITNKKITKPNVFKTIIILLLIIIQTSIYRINFSIVYTLTIFVLNMITYKIIFNFNYKELFISNILTSAILIISDLTMAILCSLIIDVSQIRSSTTFGFIATVAGCLLCQIINLQTIKEKLQMFYKILIKSENKLSKISFITSIVSLIIILFHLGESVNISIINILYIILFITYTMLIFIIVNDKIKHSNLLDEYDNLFTYIQNFEEWIEKDQLNRHEYKNQLAVLRLMAKSKVLKEKIDEILDDTVDINNEIINELSTLPKGGIKGLMYYKAAVAQKQKINLTVNVSLQENTYLNHLTTDQMKDMNRLIGIYFDNAIEAAKDTKKKIILAEIYEFDSKVKFVISNTFKKSSNIDNKNKKGTSSKGIGRGNGLYFASKIIKKYSRVEETQEIIDDYYIQSITLIKRKNLIQKN